MIALVIAGVVLFVAASVIFTRSREFVWNVWGVVGMAAAALIVVLVLVS